MLVALLAGAVLRPAPPPDAMVGHALPALSVPTLDGPSAAWQPGAMRGRVWVLNLWASWCSSCAVEHEALAAVASRHPVVGLDVKDLPGDAHAWLGHHGNPFAATLADRDGSTSRRLGVEAVPQTFVIDAEGIVRWHHAGAVDATSLAQALSEAQAPARQRQ